MADIDWNSELKALRETAKTDEDRKAIEAFSSAISPYLDNPNLLKTLIGKIAAPIEEIAVLVKDREFESFEALESELPKGVRIASTL